MPKTLTDLETLVRAEVGEPTAQYWTQAHIFSYINEAARTFSNDTGILLSPPKKCDIVAGTSLYEAPTDVPGPQAIIAVFYDDSELTPETPYSIVRGDGLPHETDTDTPSCYCVIYDSGKVYLMLYPVPGAALTAGLVVWFWKLATTMTTGDEACTIPDEYHEAVVAYASMLAFKAKRDYDQVKIEKDTYNDWVVRARSVVTAQIMAARQSRHGDATAKRSIF